MISIQNVMSADHKRCDELYADAELAVSKNDWLKAKGIVQAFIDGLLSHFVHEEQVLFPAFEQVSNMPNGPTEMMRHEHEQMRTLVSELHKAFENKNQDRYLGLSDTLLIYMQQHNMKEEQMLYPMIDDTCGIRSEELTKNIYHKVNGIC